MALSRSDERKHVSLLMLLLISQIYFGSMSSIAADYGEHAYVIFQDDFEDGEAEDWIINIPDEAPPGSSWAVELDDGNYVLSERGHVWAEAGDFAWMNYTFEVKVKLFTIHAGVHINFRSGPEGRYFLGIGGGALSLHKEHPSSTFYDLKVIEEGLNLNKWYNLKIVCAGNTFMVYVDDIPRLDYMDEKDPIISGRIGLEGSSDSHVHFDDIKVYTTHSLYVTHLIEEAREEIEKAWMVDANTSESEQMLAEAQAVPWLR